MFRQPLCRERWEGAGPTSAGSLGAGSLSSGLRVHVGDVFRNILWHLPEPL